MPTHNETPSTIRYVPPTKEHLEALAAAHAERRRRGATLKPKVDPLASAARHGRGIGRGGEAADRGTPCRG